jgi:predicted ribosomally synthesized peptide with nif11-like leader
MSMQAAMDFRALVSQDKGLQAEVARVLRVEELIALGARHGFEFGAQEAVAVIDSATHEDELSEFELELVAGGTPMCCNCNSGGPS